MWIRDIDGDLVNLAQCRGITVSDIDGYCVRAWLSDDQITLVRGTKAFCEAYIDRLNTQLALKEMTIVV